MQKVLKQEKFTYCVIDTKTGERVSQFYSRAKDAINKSNSWEFSDKQYVAVSFELSNPKELE